MDRSERRTRLRRLTAGAVRALRALLSARAGAIGIVTVVAIPLIGGFAGLAIDVGYWYLQRRALQNASDGAAVAGVLEIIRNNSDAGVKSVAKADAVRNGADENGVTVRVPPESGPNTGNSESVEVLISQQQPLYFASLLRIDPVTISVRSVATKQSAPQEFCVLSLVNPLIINRSDATLVDCGIASNATGNDSLNLTGVTSLTADNIHVVGDITDTGADSTTTDLPDVIGGAPVPDPLAGLQVGPLPPDVSPNPSPIVGGVTILSPGVYRDGLTIQGGANVTLSAGIYYIYDGNLKLVGNSNITGDGVTIVLTGSSPSTIGRVEMNTGVNVTLTAPTSGNFEGIVIYQDRNATPSAVGNLIRNSTLAINGSIYFPSEKLVVTGDSDISSVDPNPGCATIIGYEIRIDASTLNVTCEGGSAVNPLGLPRARLTE